MSLVHDESGKLSTARCAFWTTLIVTLGLVILDAFAIVKLAVAAYSLLGTVTIGLAAWAGGPRALQYLGPQLGGIASGLGRASAKIAKRREDSSAEHPGTEATP